MDIAPYIADLLRQHGEVNVPSLGTFYKQRKGGFYDHAKVKFFPPSHGLSFKDSDDNSVLTEYISKQKNISANTASYFIEKFVSQINSSMAIYGYAEIESLGTLTKLNEGYVFTDAVNFDDGGEFYGLQPVADLNVPASQTVTAPVLPLVDNDVKTDAESPGIVAEQPVEETTEERKKISTISKIIVAAASLILIGIITYLVYPQAFEPLRQKTGIPENKIPAKVPVMVIQPKSLADSMAEADTIYQELAKQGFEVEKPRDTLEVSTEINPVTTETAAASFEIIGAAFARRTDAETYVKQLTAKGIYAKIVENMPGSKLKISLGTFNEEALAQKELIRIKKELNKEAWIARVKPKKTN